LTTKAGEKDRGVKSVPKRATKGVKTCFEEGTSTFGHIGLKRRKEWREGYGKTPPDERKMKKKDKKRVQGAISNLSWTKEKGSGERICKNGHERGSKGGKKGMGRHKSRSGRRAKREDGNEKE